MAKRPVPPPENHVHTVVSPPPPKRKTNKRQVTGLCDSNGKMIHVGDKIKRKVTCNTDYHGSYSIYEVCLRGIVPVLFYVTSEKGDKFPWGYTGTTLSDCYDSKMFLFARSISDIRPTEQIEVIS